MSNDAIKEIADSPYIYGFSTDIEVDQIEKGLSEEVVRTISKKKNEPIWMLNFRLKALAHFFKLLEEEKQPLWASTISQNRF